jgi:hypothetical protein
MRPRHVLLCFMCNNRKDVEILHAGKPLAEQVISEIKFLMYSVWQDFRYSSIKKLMSDFILLVRSFHGGKHIDYERFNFAKSIS